jgi:hypothetical protein
MLLPRTAVLIARGHNPFGIEEGWHLCAGENQRNPVGNHQPPSGPPESTLWGVIAAGNRGAHWAPRTIPLTTSGPTLVRQQMRDTGASTQPALSRRPGPMALWSASRAQSRAALTTSTPKVLRPAAQGCPALSGACAGYLTMTLDIRNTLDIHTGQKERGYPG